ncbi:MAG: hypothetical protein Q4G43_15410 [Mobilicoccus sp.]|nr:hypothetical protein [Mobilicoccus sp.]
MTLLLIGTGFGVVSTLAIGVEGQLERALAVSAVPAVLGYTALVLSRGHGSSIVPATLFNLLLAATAVGIAVHDGAVLASSRNLHPFVSTALGMSILLQAAVLVVTLESIRRLRDQGGPRVGNEGGL